MIVKKILFGTVVLMCCLTLTACIDVVENVSSGKDGSYMLNYRVTVSKALFAMADADYEDTFDGFEEEDIPSYLKDVQKIDTDLEYGVTFQINSAELLKSKDISDDDKIIFVPQLDGNTLEVPLLDFSSEAKSSESQEDADSQAVGQAMLSSAKYRIYVDKNTIPEVSSVILYAQNETGEQQQVYTPVFYELPEMTCIEISFGILLSDTCKKPVLYIQ